MVAGTKGGKTSFGPWWLWREINECGAGDYIAVTATYDLFKFKLLPALRQVFEEILGIGRWWASGRVMELRDPRTGSFLAQRADDLMYARIITRSADSQRGLESGDAKAAVLDEAGMYSVAAWRAIKRRLALNQGRALLTTTLYDLGWVDTDILERAEKGGTTTIAEENDGEIEITENTEFNISVVQFDSLVNPVYPRSEYEEAERDLPDDEFQAFHRGRRVALRTLIYDSFVESPRTCKRFRIPRGWERWVGHDFGGVNMVAIFYAQKPGTNMLYCYRVYEESKHVIDRHVQDMLDGEQRMIKDARVDEQLYPHHAVGGAPSEDQWRDEFSDAGWPIEKPSIGDLWLGINRVYASHSQGRITYFDDLEGIIGDKRKYRRKKDKQDNVINEIHNKHAFHRMDGERYIISEFMGPQGASWDDVGDLGEIEDFESAWA